MKYFVKMLKDGEFYDYHEVKNKRDVEIAEELVSNNGAYLEGTIERNKEGKINIYQFKN